MQIHLYEHFDILGHANYLEDVTVTLIHKKILGTLLKEKIIGYIPLKLKHLWVLIWDMVSKISKV